MRRLSAVLIHTTRPLIRDALMPNGKTLMKTQRNQLAGMVLTEQQRRRLPGRYELSSHQMGPMLEEWTKVLLP